MGLRCALAVCLALLAAVPGRTEPLPSPLADAGVYRDAGLTAYVGRVGGRLLAAAGIAGQGWRFSVLDSPEPNAFVLPDRQIVVTRGMLALANDEAELAAVLGHEVGHAVSGDDRRGASSTRRRAAEFEADRLGMSYLARAGYDATAQADFLRALLASQVLEAKLYGGDPRRAGIGGRDHPALADRVQEATRSAEAFGRAGKRDRSAYLKAIDGLVWGDGPAQGFLRGRTFVHPDLGFAFDAPAGYTLVNAPDVVSAQGPRDAILVVDSVPDPGGDPAAYLLRAWMPEIAVGVQAGSPGGARSLKLNGMAAAEASLPLANDGSHRVADLTVVRHRGRLYRLTGLYRPGDAAAAATLRAAAQSFRSLSRSEAAALPPLRIAIRRIEPGEDVTAMAAGMPVGAGSRALFDVINGLRPGKSLRIGDAVKVVE